MKLINLENKKFGRLLVLVRSGGKHCVNWICLCNCGNIIVTNSSNLRSGNTKSCGCFKSEISKNNKVNITHGKSKTPEFNSWTGMLTRCYNKNAHAYKHYGGRGIKVCSRWRNSFEKFLKDMGYKPYPKKKYSIDRKNNNKSYGPSNCKWSTHKQQNNNKRQRT